MTAPTNHWKLGLFVVTAALVALIGIGLFAGRALRKDTVQYTSYFDEAVNGLGNGSPVTYRGVKIGKVSDINIAPDRRHVEVQYELGVDELKRLGLAKERGRKTTIQVPDDLRVQVGAGGLTGSKYLQIDFFPPATHPPRKLPFRVPDNYIPATPSTIKNLETSVTQAVDQFPALAQQAEGILAQVHEILVDVKAQQLPEHAAGTLASATAAFAALRLKTEQVPVEGLTRDAHSVLVRADALLTHADEVVARANTERGLVASLQRASDAVGDVAGNANYVVSDLGTTLRDLREAVDSVRELADELARDPDMLIKGRARTSE